MDDENKRRIGEEMSVYRINVPAIISRLFRRIILAKYKRDNVHVDNEFFSD